MDIFTVNCQRIADHYELDKPISILMVELLKQFYGNSGRHYHGLNHINDCLLNLNNLESDLDFKVTSIYLDYNKIITGIIFHDAIYNPTSKTNEEDSAELFQSFFYRSNMPLATIEEIKDFILATKHINFNKELDPKGKDINRCILLDLDLASLGYDPSIFFTNGGDIRKEYGFVDNKLFYSKRIDILSNFLSWNRIYYTNYFFDKYEAQARKNLRHEIETCNSILDTEVATIDNTDIVVED